MPRQRLATARHACGGSCALRSRNYAGLRPVVAGDLMQRMARWVYRHACRPGVGGAGPRLAARLMAYALVDRWDRQRLGDGNLACSGAGLACGAGRGILASGPVQRHPWGDQCRRYAHPGDDPRLGRAARGRENALALHASMTSGLSPFSRGSCCARGEGLCFCSTA